MGAEIAQQLDGRWKPTAFFSRKFSPTQRRYSTYDMELLAIFEAVKSFRQLLFISEFTTDIRHISREDDVVTDALSRAPSSPVDSAIPSGSFFLGINALLAPSINYQQLADDQTGSEEIQNNRTACTSLKF